MFQDSFSEGGIYPLRALAAIAAIALFVMAVVR
jgi:hypothetical protein